MENHDYLCYEIFAPGRTDEDAISNICICRSEKEKRGWIDEMIKSLSSPDVNGVKYTVAKIEGKEVNIFIDFHSIDNSRHNRK